MSQSSKVSEEQVSPQTASIRLKYIRDFLHWRVNQAAQRTDGEAKRSLIAVRDFVDAELENSTPSHSTRTVLSQRYGISSEAQATLVRAVDPCSSPALWIGNHIKLRNQLIVHALLSLGIRRGELLGLRTSDFNPIAQEVLILRRPDDASDPRLYEPNAKTRDRILPVSYALHCLVKRYATVRHQRVKGRHDFLFIANNGRPMSLSTVNRVFEPLRGVVPEILSPHVLRHTFFENLAANLHGAGQTDTQVQSILTTLGGWSEFSQSPLRYTSRFARERANDAGLELQSRLYLKVGLKQ